MKKISETTGLTIVCSTGYYYEGRGGSAYFKVKQGQGTAEEEIYEMFMHEITVGIGRTGVKPGVIKLASSKNEITEYEQLFFRAAARAHKETGIPIITHTEEGTMGPEQAELLGSLGVDLSKVIIGHMCGNTNIDYHERVLEQGVYVAFDRYGLQGPTRSDALRNEMILHLIEKGYSDQLMMSHDTVNYWLGRPPVYSDQAKAAIANWVPTHIFDHILPELREKGLTEKQEKQIFIENVKAYFS